jgi:hypothetical protein
MPALAAKPAPAAHKMSVLTYLIESAFHINICHIVGVPHGIGDK